MRDGAMAWLTIRANTKSNSAVHRRLNWIVPSTIDLKTNSSTFIERIFSPDQFGTILYNPTRTLRSSDFLISGCHKDDISFQTDTTAFEKQHGHCLHGDHVFHIECATP